MFNHDVIPHVGFNWMIVVYFFLGGLSAGCYFFSVGANYWKKEFKPMARVSAYIAPIVLAIGMLFLLLDLGQPFRAWRLFLSFNPTSVVSWGTWFLSIFFVLSLAYAWFLSKDSEQKAKKYAYAGLPFAFLVATYSGLLLAQSAGNVLWHTALIPFLFLLGGLISGTAVVLLVSAGKQEKNILSKLGRFIVWLIIFELILIAYEVIVLFNGGTESVIAVKSMLSGQYSILFWLVEIILGALIPIFILLRTKISATAQVIASILILIGIFAMRYIVVIGGQYVG